MMKPKTQQKIIFLDDSGFSILESLVGMLVASLLLAAIAPVLVMSTAIRIQARRVEIASQAAKTFIDGVRVGSITTPDIISQLDVATTISPRNIANSPDDYFINATEMPAPSSASGLYCYLENGIISATNCVNNQFYIQAGRIVQGQELNDGYRLAIRVYRADIDFTKTVKTNTDSNIKQTTSTINGKLGDKQAPLIEITTDIANSNTTFQALCQRLGTPLVTPMPSASPVPVVCQ